MRAVVVGAGVMGRWHAHALRRLGHTLVAVVDPLEPAAAAIAGSASRRARTFVDLPSCLGAVGADVVHVCTPPESHAELVRTAIAAGAGVLVEKPLAPSLAETEALLDAADAAGVRLAPVHQFPFEPGFLDVLARRDRLGDLVRVAYRTCSAGGEGRPPDGRRSLLTEILPHPVSLLDRWAPGFRPESLEVRVFDEDDLVLAGRDGRVQIDVSISLRGRPACNELHVVGTRASAFVDLFHGYGLIEDGRVSGPRKLLRPFRLGGGIAAAAAVNLGRRAARREPKYPGLRTLIRAFYASVADGSEPPVGRTETLAAAALIDAVRG